MSDETNCFIADLYINGKKVGSCENDGRGGCTNYGGNTKADNVLIAEAEKYCKTLPHDEFGEQSLEDVINDLLEDHLKAKEHKKREKLFNTAIVFGVPNGNSYQYIKYNRPLSEVPTVVLQRRVNEIVLTYCKKGVKILNTNFDELGLNIP